MCPLANGYRQPLVRSWVAGSPRSWRPARLTNRPVLEALEARRLLSGATAASPTVVRLIPFVPGLYETHSGREVVLPAGVFALRRSPNFPSVISNASSTENGTGTGQTPAPQGGPDHGPASSSAAVPNGPVAFTPYFLANPALETLSVSAPGGRTTDTTTTEGGGGEVSAESVSTNAQGQTSGEPTGPWETGIPVLHFAPLTLTFPGTDSPADGPNAGGSTTSGPATTLTLSPSTVRSLIESVNLVPYAPTTSDNAPIAAGTFAPSKDAGFGTVADGGGGGASWSAGVPTQMPMSVEESAHVMGEGDFAAYQGQVDDSHPDQYMRLPLPGRAPLDLTFTANEPFAKGLEGVVFSIYDESGRELFQGAPAPGVMQYSMNITPGSLPGLMDHLFVRVGLTGTSGALPSSNDPSNPEAPSLSAGASDAAVGFLFSVQRTGNGNAPSASGETTVAAPVASSTGKTSATEGVLTSTSAAESPGAAAGQAAAEPSSGTATEPVPVATGPLPTRAAPAMGGVLGAGGDPTPVVNARDAALVDLALLDLLDPEGAAEPAAPVALVDADEAVVAVRGAGGFPLFASSLLTRPSRGRARARELDAPPTDLTPPAALPGLATTPLVTSTAGDAPPLVEGRRGSTTGTARRVSALAGMSLAVAFVSHLALPTLTDAADGRSRRRSWVRSLLPGRDKPV